MASRPALLIIDLVNTFAFEDGQALARESRKIAPVIARIKAGMKRRGSACIYVNDNFGQWTADFSTLVHSVAWVCSRRPNPGSRLAVPDR